MQFESSKDYDITSAYAVRGWNTTEGHMKITVRAAPLAQTQHFSGLCRAAVLPVAQHPPATSFPFFSRAQVPTQLAKHGGRYGMQVSIIRAFAKNFHAQFSLPHFMPRMVSSSSSSRQAFTRSTPFICEQISTPFWLPFSPRAVPQDHSAYGLTLGQSRATQVAITPEVAFLDVDEGYEWVGGATLSHQPVAAHRVRGGLTQRSTSS